MLGVRKAEEGSQYLGLPSSLGWNKTRLFNFIKERIRRRIEGWDNKILSRAGKEILIKTVVQELLCYAMSVFYTSLGYL